MYSSYVCLENLAAVIVGKCHPAHYCWCKWRQTILNVLGEPCLYTLYVSLRLVCIKIWAIREIKSLINCKALCAQQKPWLLFNLSLKEKRKPLQVTLNQSLFSYQRSDGKEEPTDMSGKVNMETQSKEPDGTPPDPSPSSAGETILICDSVAKKPRAQPHATTTTALLLQGELWSEGWETDPVPHSASVLLQLAGDTELSD